LAGLTEAQTRARRIDRQLADAGWRVSSAPFEVEYEVVPEQQLIVRRLDLAKSLCKRYAQLAGMAEELLQSVFLEIFDDPVSNPRNWPVDPLDKCLKGIEAGWSARPLAG
jgi:hypothetical protein